MSSDTSNVRHYTSTVEYHAQLYSGQKELQDIHRQQQEGTSYSIYKPIAVKHRIILFEAPNLYLTSLKLTSEIDIHAWWASLVKIFSDTSFHATRIALSIPQDPNDPFMGPWGLKAVYNKTNSISHEDTHGPTDSGTEDNEKSADYFLNANKVHSSFPRHVPWCFDRIQPFETEPEPLINNISVQRILKRNSLVVLSREYRRKSTDKFNYEDRSESFKRTLYDQSNDKKPTMARRLNLTLPIITTPCFSRNESSEILVDGSVCEEALLENGAGMSVDSTLSSSHPTFLQDYDEYEQQQPSPWSQSPAPSPAIIDSEINPFFQLPPDIDDDAFNPVSPETYDSTSVPFPPPISNVHSVVHVPLYHPLDIMDQRNNRCQSCPTPLAILSFLAPVVPYPPVLLSSVSSLSPFIATSFTNAIYNAQTAKQKHPLHRRRTSSDGHRSNSKRRGSNTKLNVEHSFYDDDDDEKNSHSHSHSSNTTPRADVDRKLDRMDSNFTRSSLDTKTDIESTHSYSYKVGTPHFALSPSTMALIEGWKTSSPDLPLSSTAPPETSRQEFIANQSISSPTSPSLQVLSCRKKKKTRQKRSLKRRNFKKYRLGEHNKTYHDKQDQLFVAPKSRLLRLIIDGIPIHVFTCSTVSGLITWVNHRTLQYTGKNLKEHLGARWLSHMHPDDRPECSKAWGDAFEKGKGFSGEYRLKRFDGIYRCFLWRIVPLRDMKGQIIHWFGTCTDVHDQREAKENSQRQTEIESNERKYRLLAEAIPQIVFTFSPESGLTYANGQWGQYSGKTFEQTMGLGFMSCVHQEDRCKLQLPDLPPSSHKAGISWDSEIRLLSREDEYRWFLVKCVSVDEFDTGEVRWFGTCTDINDHKLLEKKLKEAHDAAQKSTESKTRFLSNMSHEIRTPLIGITGMLTFLIDTKLTAEQIDFVHTIQQSAESLLVVINDILDLSKVEAGMMKLEWEPFSVVTMIEDANELLSTLAIQKNLELSFWVDDDVPDVVIGDRIRLRQNAIKFTSEGEVFTKCTVQNRDKDESVLTLLFEVVDTGAGFDSLDESVMFKPFSQVDNSSTRKHGGSGLGLVISRQLIELHGGTMRCRSEKGKGSTFFFTVKFGIPVSQTKPQPHTPQNESQSDPFFRSNGYDNIRSIGYHEEDRGSPVTFANSIQQEKSLFIPSVMAHSKKHTEIDDVSPSEHTDILQDFLINKAATMQLKPPPIKNPSSTTDLDISGQLVTTFSNKLNDLPTPTLNARQPGIPYNSVVMPPRTPTKASPLRTLIVSGWELSRESIKKHVVSILSSIGTGLKESHYHIDTLTNHLEASEWLNDPGVAPYDYIIINLSSDHHILSLTRTICSSLSQQQANVLVVTTPMQRSLITGTAKGREEELIPKLCGFVFKPLKRTKLQWYFGLHKKTSTDHSSKQFMNSGTATPDTPYRKAATQKEIFRRMIDDIGGRGFKVLLVEDNLVNQKVLTRYLKRIGLDVDVACHGGECIDFFLGHPKGYYSLILCDLFMPVKDGYETTKEIRKWEKDHLEKDESEIPIIALSANVMSDVAAECSACGFSTYISKPVHFAILSDIIRDYLLKK
ncbi:hypothetical protein BDB01DRAFT_713854 [Pilobolus umbonatus]|nr:hypothetical protein BDB01DRAFT_713854 [Pilobolus umbonatus]